MHDIKMFPTATNIITASRIIRDVSTKRTSAYCKVVHVCVCVCVCVCVERQYYRLL
jgi:hypothetical protein